MENRHKQRFLDLRLLWKPLRYLVFSWWAFPEALVGCRSRRTTLEGAPSSSLCMLQEKKRHLFWANATDAMCSHIIPSVRFNTYEFTCERAAGRTRTCKSHLSFFWVLWGVSNSADPTGERNDDVIRNQSIHSRGCLCPLKAPQGLASQGNVDYDQLQINNLY